ncbi:MAG: group III truncated hemoglobin [Phycisphaerales bacterium]|nr:group III truncated hemoglobin [Phycisphaerales bacterium]
MNKKHLNLDLASESTPNLKNTEITTDTIREMVELFYTRTQQDDLLGPIFTEIVEDWDAHYEKMTRFWSSAVLKSGTYSGRPIEAHKFGGLTQAHFLRWIELFTKTVQDVFTQSEAAIFVDLGRKMASSIAMRIGTGRLSF